MNTGKTNSVLERNVTDLYCKNQVFLQLRYVSCIYKITYFRLRKDMNIKLFTSIILLQVFCISGCSETFSTIVATAWSDNSEKIAFLEQRHKEKSTGVSKTIGNVKFRLGIINKEGDEKQYITDYFSRSPSGRAYSSLEIFFKSNAGYFVVKIGESGTYSINGVPFTDNYDYHVFDMNGTILHSISKQKDQYCEYNTGLHPSIRVVPSPDGNYLAVFKTLSTCELDIQILDVNDDFSITDTQRIAGITSVGMFWIGEDQLYVNACLTLGSCDDNWVLIKPGVESITIDPELFSSLCLDGVTLSGNVNSNGENIVWNDLSEPILIENIKNDISLGLNWRFVSINRELDNPENCVNIE